MATITKSAPRPLGLWLSICTVIFGVLSTYQRQILDEWINVNVRGFERNGGRRRFIRRWMWNRCGWGGCRVRIMQMSSVRMSPAVDMQSVTHTQAVPMFSSPAVDFFSPFHSHFIVDNSLVFIQISLICIRFGSSWTALSKVFSLQFDPVKPSTAKVD